MWGFPIERLSSSRTGSRAHNSGSLVALSLALLGLLAVAATADAKPKRFELDVSPRSGGIDDEFRVTMIVQLEGLDGPDQLWNPEMADFKVINRQIAPTRTMQYDKVRGRVLTTTEVRTYSVVPRKAGRLYIGPGKIRVGGDEFSTRTIGVSVGTKYRTKAGPPASRAGGIVAADDPTASGGIGAPGFHEPQVEGTPDQFLHAVVDKRTPYLGEQVTITWLLYVKEELLKFEPSPLRLDDFWSELLYEPTHHLTPHFGKVNGRRYRISIVSKRALFPTRAGEVSISPFRGKVQTNYSRLGAFAAVESETVLLQVKELPDGAPQGFDSTYVGQLQVAASVDRTRLEAGGSLTLTLEVSGAGALRRTSPPDLKTGGFEFRAPRDFDESVDISGPLVQGKRTYRYWTTPQQGGAQSIPPLGIAYFDPHTARYEIAQTQPISIHVAGDLTADDASSDNYIAPDIRVIRDGATISSVTMARAYRSIWYWGLALVPVLAFAGVVAAGYVRRGMQKDTQRSRLRRARGKARRRFRVADIHLRGNRPSKFFGELSGAIYSHLEERAGQPLRSLTRVELETELRTRGFDDELVERVEQELSNCDFARFTPAACGPGEMKDALERTRDLLRDIERSDLTPASQDAV